MTNFSTSIYENCSVSLTDLSRQQFDSLQMKEEVSEVNGVKFWSKHIRMGQTMLHFHTQEPPSVPTFPKEEM